MRKILMLMLMIAFSLSSSASLKQVKKAAESLCLITSYDKDSKVLATGCGVFVESGVGVAQMSLFKGAHKVIAMDVDGHSFAVTRICGADELYDVIKFKVDAPTSFAKLAKGRETEKMWIADYTSGSPSPQPAAIDNVETFMEKYSYYVLNSAVNKQDEGVLFTDNGKVAGILQKSSAGAIHATDALYISTLYTYGLAINNPAVKCCDIALELPKKKEEALLMMLLSVNKNDKVQHEASVSDFIKMFPDMPDGYQARAQLSAGKKDYASADRDMKEAVRIAVKKGEFYFNYSKMIFSAVSSGSHNYPDWTYDRAYALADLAYEEDKQPVYSQLMAQILFSEKKYAEAYDKYIGIVKEGKVYPDAYYGAAQCRIMQDAPKEEIIALLDSAVNSCDSINYRISAPYVFLRASVYTEMGEYRKAVTDYYRYEILNDGEMNAQFFYLREQTELKAKMYQQALTDIHRAIILAPEEVLYYAEAGALELKVKMYEEAEAMGRKCIKMAPDYSEGYLILGLALKYQGRESEADEALKKAEQLGKTPSDT